ncbi:MAG TPA: serine/threonine-protein kinase [Bryobacteraceae bacterium]|jgi:serine/threonine protein kinase/tetratricopeptide (TPR) repeat protein|nr:serine/threonine-protein kinase [Bryobacteraceae bacterium]
MTSEDWARVRSLLEAALEQPDEQRREFLDLMCSDDSDLRAEIEELLRVESQADSLFGGTGWSLAAITADSLVPGTRVGVYRIRGLLDEGGMGSVYLAERADEAYAQVVALKVVQSSIANGDALERFMRERQTLARLNHPGIARLLDGGITPDGRPYLVMEYVEGQSIDRYCDERRLNVRERIELVLAICEAVQHAHQNLVVHRDIKPANILVNAEGHPKLLDFGIAKWLGDATPKNAPTIQILTPSYASPEQASKEPVSTATDVYSLAVLLYELLTGSLPHDVNNLPPHEALRRLTETEPKLASEAVSEKAAAARRSAPKALRSTLRGDLDTILQCALRREPARRYASIEAFAGDLRRWLLDRPILARPDSLLYRTRKFVQRRKAVVGLGVVSAALLTLAVLGMWHSYRTAQAERAIAERRYENGRTLVQAYLTEVDRKLEGMPGTAGVRSLIARRNLEYLDRMTADAGNDLPLERELAQAYFLIGRTQRLSAQSSADRQQARTNMDKAVRLRQAIFSATGDLQDRGQLAYLLSQTGTLLVQEGRLSEAIAYHRRACALAQPIFAASAKGLNYLRAANACWNLATDYIGNEQAPNAGKLNEGLQGQLETLERFDNWRRANPDNAMGYPYVASMEAMTAADLWRVGRYAEAKQHYEAALEILHGPHGLLSHQISAGYLATAETYFSMMLVDGHEDRAALSHAAEAVAIAGKQLAAQKDDPGWQTIDGLAEIAQGRALAHNGDFREPLTLVETGVERLLMLYQRDPADAEAAGALVRGELWAADTEAVTGARERASEHALHALELARSALRTDPIDALAAANEREARAQLQSLEEKENATAAGN